MSIYAVLLLTLTNYAPPSHNLKFQRALAEEQDRSLVEAWPREQSTQRAWFNTLVEAYVKARYSKHYRIDREALLWLGECTQRLHQLVEASCRRQLRSEESRVGQECVSTGSSRWTPYPRNKKQPLQPTNKT